MSKTFYYSAIFRALTITSVGVFTGFASVSSAQIIEPALAVEAPLDLFSGTWENDRGSGVTFAVKEGLVSGFYQTALGAPDKSKKFPLVGFTKGDQITFTVNFTGFGSLTSWTGQLTRDEAGDYIRTLWNLTRDVPDEKEDDDLWQSIVSGASDFRRVKP